MWQIRNRLLGLACAVLAVGLCSCAASRPFTTPAEGGRATNVSVLVGLREFDEDDWEPLEEQIAFAVEVELLQPGCAGLGGGRVLLVGRGRRLRPLL